MQLPSESVLPLPIKGAALALPRGTQGVDLIKTPRRRHLCHQPDTASLTRVMASKPRTERFLVATQAAS